MTEVHSTQNLFSFPNGPSEAIVITTNGVLRKNGDAVCGAGLALAARQVFPDLEKNLGRYLRKYGNRVFHHGVRTMGNRSMVLITFPTKHHFKDSADPELIRTSARQLKALTDKFHLTKAYMPAVGCGLGKLDYEKQVKPILTDILDDDRFVVVLRYKNL